MKLLIDIGNSTIVVATANDKSEIVNTWRFKTLKEGTVSFFRHEIWNGIKKYRITADEVDAVIVSSVVPEVNDDIAQAVTDLLGKAPHFFNANDARNIIKVNIESPSQLGKDRLADAIGAIKCYGVPCIIIDLGTATTIGVVDENHTFIGGMIIPGVKTSLTALCARASQLPAINVEKPHQLIGRNTLECMQSGIVNGTAAMIDGIIDQILPTLNSDNIHLVATGGMARSIIPFCHHDIKIDDFLQLKGISLVHSS